MVKEMVLFCIGVHCFIKGVKKMSAFKNIDWDNLLNMEPPFVPEPDNSLDTSYFEGIFFSE